MVPGRVALRGTLSLVDPRGRGGAIGESLDRIVQSALELCEADVVRLSLRAPEGAAWLIAETAGRPVPAAPSDALAPLLATGRPLRLADALRHRRLARAAAGELGRGRPIRLLAVPLGNGADAAGLLYVARRARPFTARDEAVLSLLAERAALVLAEERVDRTAVTQPAGLEAQQLRALVEMQEELLGATDEGRHLDLVIARAQALFGAQGAIRLVDGDQLVPRAESERGRPALPVALGQGISGRCAEARTGLLVNDYPAWPFAIAAYAARGLRHAMAQPLIVGDSLAGVITLSRWGATAQPFDADDLARLGHFATHAALALRNVSLYQEAQRRRREADALAGLARSLTQTLDPAEIGRRTVEQALTVIQAHSAAVRLARPDGMAEWTASAGRFRVELGQVDQGVPALIGRVMAEGRALQIGTQAELLDVITHPAWRAEIVAAEVRSLLAVPLRAGDWGHGILLVVDGRERAFSAAEVELLQSFADQAALAFDNARRFAAETRQRQEQETLVEIGHDVLRELEPSQILRLVVERAAALTRADGAIHRLDGDELVPEARTSDGLHLSRVPVGTGILGRCVAESRGLLVNDYPAWPHALDGWRELGVQHAVACPLEAGNQTLGGIVLARQGASAVPFVEADLQLLRAFATAAALALRNALLYEEARRRRAQAEALAGAAHMLTETLDPLAVGERFTRSALELVAGVAAWVYEARPDGSLVLLGAAGHIDTTARPGSMLPRSRQRAYAVLRDGRARWSADVLKDPETEIDEESRARFATLGIRAILFVPLRSSGRAVGVLVVADRAGRTFASEEIAVIQALADNTSTALANARLYEDARRRQREAEVLGEVARALTATLDLEEVLRILALKTRELTGAAARIALWEPGRECMRIRHVSGAAVPLDELPIVPGKGARGWSLAHGQPFRTDDYLSDSRIGTEYHEAVRAEGLTSFLVVPVVVDGQVEALLMVGSERPGAFTDRDEEVLVRLAEHASLAIRNAQLFEEARRRQREAQTLARASRALTETLDPLAIGERFARIAHEMVGGVACGVIEMQSETTAVVLGISRTGPGVTLPGTVVPRAGQMVDQVARDGQARWTPDVFADPRYAPPPDWAHRPLFERLGASALLAVPLRAAGRTLGVLVAADRAGRAYRPDEIALVQALADDAALALDHGRLYAEAQRRRAAAERLAEISRSLTERLDLPTVGQRIADSAARLLDMDIARLRLLEPDGSLALVAATPAASGETAPPLRPDSPGVHVLRSMTGAVWVADAAQDVASDPLRAQARRGIQDELGVRAWIVAPLRLAGETIGSLLVGTAEARPISPDHVALAEVLADHAAVAVRNARLYEEAERRRHEAEVVARTARALSESLDLDTVLHRVAEGAREACASDIARIALLDAETGEMVFRYWVNTRHDGSGDVRVRPGQGLGGHVMRSGRPERTENWETDARLSDWNPAMVRREGLVAMMAVPITIDGRVEGLLYVDNRTARSFTERDEAVVVQLAEHAAIAIKNARLFGAVEAGGRRLQALSARLLEVQEEERRHLSRELHDEIGQALTALKINLQMIKRQVGPVPATSRLDDSLGVVDRILQGVRRMSLDLRPSLLDDLGLAPAVRWYVTSQAERAALDAEVTIDGVEGADVPGPLATTCFRIVQEALTNALRHASPTRLTVTLRREEAGLRLAVRDDGVGFDVTGARRRALAGASMGLLGLTERAELAGGRAVIESAPGQGTTVTVWLPLGPREPRDEADSPP